MSEHPNPILQQFINRFSMYQNDLRKIIKFLEEGKPDMARFAAREMLNSVSLILDAAIKRQKEKEEEDYGRINQ